MWWYSTFFYAEKLIHLASCSPFGGKIYLFSILVFLWSHELFWSALAKGISFFNCLQVIYNGMFQDQKRALSMIQSDSELSSLTLVEAPLVDVEIRGVPALQFLGDIVWKWILSKVST